MVVDKYAALCKCIYIVIIGNQLKINILNVEMSRL